MSHSGDDEPADDGPSDGSDGTPDARDEGTPTSGGTETGTGTGWRTQTEMGTGTETGAAEPGEWESTSRRGGTDDDEEFGWREFATDVASSVVAVFLVGLLLFSVSGVWPPLVAVESTSMVPHMKVGDLVFVMEEERFPGENAHGDTGVVTARAAEDYTKFKQQGDVVVYEPAGNGDTTPIIHRVMFWVNESENWYGKADRTYLGGADDCSELVHCPAPHAGFVTLGDNNDIYDQARSGLPPVKPEWVVGTAEVRVPALGWVRLRSSRGRVLTRERATRGTALDSNATTAAATNATARPAGRQVTAG